MRNKDLSIIIVDDLQFSRIVVKTALKKAGYDGVRMADSATQALNMLNEEPADVVLADWMMPEMDGLELTDRIRQRDEEVGTYTAIILFTANEGIDLLVEAFERAAFFILMHSINIIIVVFARLFKTWFSIDVKFV